MRNNLAAPSGKGTLIRSATKWSFAAELGAKMISPIINMVLARIIAPQAFGVVATINMVISLSSIFTEAGFQLYIVQHDYDDEQDMYAHVNTAFWASLGIAGVMLIFICLFRNQIANLIGSTGHANAIVIASISIPLVAMNSILSSLYRRSFDYKTLFYRRLLALGAPFLITIPLALLRLGHWALIIGTLSGHLVNWIVLVMRSPWRVKMYFNVDLFKRMLPFCLTTMGGYAANWLATWSDVFIVSHILGEFYTGLYKTSQVTVTSILSTVSAALTPVLFSVLCRYQNDNRKFSSTLVSFTQKLSIFMIPLGVGFLLSSRTVTTLLLGNNWQEAAPFIGIWGFCTAMNATYSTYAREAARAKGKPQLPLFAQILQTIIMIPVCYIAALRGYNVLIYVRSIVSLVLVPFYFIMYKRYLGISPLMILKATKAPWVAAVGMGSVAFALMRGSPSFLAQMIIILVCVVVYFGLLALFPQYKAMGVDLLIKLRNRRLITKENK